MADFPDSTPMSEIDNLDAPTIIDMVDEAGAIDTLFEAMHLMAAGLSISEESDAFSRVLTMVQDRFAGGLKKALQRWYDLENAKVHP